MIERDKGFKEMESLMKTWDMRTTYFMREFVAHMSDVFLEQLLDRIPTDERTKKYIESFRVFIAKDLSKNINDKERDVKKITKPQEYWAGVEAVQASKNFHKLQAERTLLHVKKSRTGTIVLSDMLLFRYQPWTLDTIPWIPRGDDVYLVYEEVGLKTFYQERIKIRKNLKKALTRAKKDGLKEDPDLYIVKKLDAVHNIIDIALKMEFSLSAIKKQHWRPAIKYLRTVAWKNAMKRRKDLDLVLFDPRFKKFKNSWRGRQKGSAETVKSFEYFQDKITGKDGI